MKFLKTTTLALVVSLSLAPMSSAWARNGRHGLRGGSAIHGRSNFRGGHGFRGGHRFRGGHGFRGRHHGIPIHSSSTTIIERHDNGAAFVALASGTMLGFVVGSLVNQPHPTAPPQVVVVQANQQRYLELEIERERAKARTLELELELRYLEQGLY